MERPRIAEEQEVELFAPAAGEAPGPPLIARAFGATDRGRVRPTNQDQFVIATLTGSLWIEQSSFPQARVQCGGPQGHVFVVADGLGGHAGGAEASVLAVEALESFLLSALGWLEQLDGRDAVVLDELKSALRRADAAVTAEATARPELAAMGTTLTMACSIENVLYIAHAGDSRCYLRREGLLHQLTHDHTIVSELVDAGVLEREAARHHELRHMVTNVVGGGTSGVRAEVHKLCLKADDILLLCTDGLTEAVPLERIDAILESRKDPQSACRRLVAAANDEGGFDNVTALVARFDAHKRAAPNEPS
jgi:serine/threonine protein phosphatase PrpC